MGQSWQRPKGEPRLGRVEVWVERARNLAPEEHDTIKTWTDAHVWAILVIQGAARSWRGVSEKKVCVRLALGVGVGVLN